MKVQYDDQRSTKILRVQQWHFYLGSNQHLSNLIKWEIISGPGDLANYLRIVRSWILGQNPLLLPYYTSIIPDYNITTYLYIHV